MAKDEGDAAKPASTVEFGPGYAKVVTWMGEKVGLANYSNVDYGTSITRFGGDSDEEVDALIRANEALIESWMKDYFRREVENLLGGGR